LWYVSQGMKFTFFSKEQSLIAKESYETWVRKQAEEKEKKLERKKLLAAAKVRNKDPSQKGMRLISTRNFYTLCTFRTPLELSQLC